jgi:UDP-N-acetylmuramoyl-L-alanyl-D-glutamate--2,6-diaminopimelate ligase
VPLLARFPIALRRVTADSRRVLQGDAFAAFPGDKYDGRAFIGDAVSRGASAVLWEADGFDWHADWRVAHQPVTGLKSKLGAIADAVFGHPSRALWMIGVTGTNGKTSCTHWIAQCLDACARPAAVLGTLGNGFIGALEPAQHTTADAAQVHELLARLKAKGAQAVAMEVSSHGLDQGRVNAVAFDLALFTNLTRDHLDYHGTMAAYGAAKAKLFTWPDLAGCVINADDEFGRTLIDQVTRSGGKVLTYGFDGADVTAEVRAKPEGMTLSVTTPWGKGDADVALYGSFNASNLLGVLGVLLLSDMPLDRALAAIAKLEPPAGRMQRLGGYGRPLAVVDYAHTPDALQKALEALRPSVVAGRELVCVFGCGGDRDKGKRPQMGAIAGGLADRVIRHQ